MAELGKLSFFPFDVDGLILFTLIGLPFVLAFGYRYGILRQFTLRDLLWLTLVVAMGLDWRASSKRADYWEQRALYSTDGR